MRLILALLTLWAFDAYAQPYAGLRFSDTRLQPNIAASARIGSTYEVHEGQGVVGLYGGYARGAWSVEIGGGELAKRESNNVSATYDIRQDISSSYVYAGLLRHWHYGHWSAHAMLAAARVSFKNHEYGWNETGPAENLNYGADRAPMYALGAGYDFGRLTLRADAFVIRDVIRSWWTRPGSDIKGVSVSLEHHF